MESHQEEIAQISFVPEEEVEEKFNALEDAIRSQVGALQVKSAPIQASKETEAVTA